MTTTIADYSLKFDIHPDLFTKFIMKNQNGEESQIYAFKVWLSEKLLKLLEK